MSEFDPPIQQDALASVGQRALAQIIDGLVLLPVLFLVVYLMSGEIPIPTEEDQVSSVDVWATFALVVIQVAYNTVCVAMWGATVGKRALRLRVVQLRGTPRADPRRGLADTGDRYRRTHRDLHARALPPAAQGLARPGGRHHRRPSLTRSSRSCERDGAVSRDAGGCRRSGACVASPRPTVIATSHPCRRGRIHSRDR
jgi:RDD family